jgi:hypothetical protein
VRSIHPIARLAAVLGGFTHVAAAAARSALWFAPRAIPWGLVVAGLLGVAAWQALEAARSAEAAQPRPLASGLAPVVDGEANGWVALQALVSGPHLDSTAYGAPVLRFYYVLFDPADPAVAMVARSLERLEERRTRTVVVDVRRDPQAVAAALDDLPTEEILVDPDRYLVERAERPSSLAEGDIAPPAGLPDPPARAVVQGDWVAARPVPCSDGETCPGGRAWEYLVTGPGRGVVVRSPYPPDALPVDVWGVAATDPQRVRQALDLPAVQSAIGDRRHPSARLLADGAAPLTFPVSYVAPIVLGAAAGLLAVGWLLGYPIFVRGHRAPPPAAPIPVGRSLPVEVDGRILAGARSVWVAGAPGALELLPPSELERREWQYSLRTGGIPPLADAAAGPPRLALHSAEGPFLLRLDPAPPGLRVTPGQLHRVRGTRPALRLRAAGVDLIASFRHAGQVSRAMAAIDPGHRLTGADGAAVEDSGDEPNDHESEPSRLDPAAPAVQVAAWAIFVAIGLLVAASGAAGVVGALIGGDRSPLFGSALVVAVGVGVALIGRGLRDHRDWAWSVGMNVAGVGALAALFLAIASPTCGLWLAPNFVACQAAGPLGALAALLVAAGFGFSLWALAGARALFLR